MVAGNFVNLDELCQMIGSINVDEIPCSKYITPTLVSAWRAGVYDALMGVCDEVKTLPVYSGISLDSEPIPFVPVGRSDSEAL